MKSVRSMVGVMVLVLATAPAWSSSKTTINIGRSDVSLTVPEDYSRHTAVPLIVILHGYTDNSGNHDRYMKFSSLVDEYEFLLLAPDGTKEAGGQNHPFWNATDACCDFQGSEVDDSKYLAELIREVRSKYSVDGNRIYMFGHSNGGFMVHRMAFDHPNTIAAVGALAGAAMETMEGEAPERPVSILQIHGTKDRLNLYEGGDINGVVYPGPARGLEKWVEYTGGKEAIKIVRTKLDLDSELEGLETTVTEFGRKGRFELWTIEEGGHVPAFNDNVTRLIVEWFMDHPKEKAKKKKR